MSSDLNHYAIVIDIAWPLLSNTSMSVSTELLAFLTPRLQGSVCSDHPHGQRKPEEGILNPIYRPATRLAILISEIRLEDGPSQGPRSKLYSVLCCQQRGTASAPL